MVIENTFVDIGDFLHMDTLYRLLGRRLGDGLAIANPRALFCKPVPAGASSKITAADLMATLGPCAHNPLLLDASYADMYETPTWLDNGMLRICFV